MPKSIRYFLFGVIFLVGISIGTYLGTNNNSQNYDNQEEEKEQNNIVPVQDIVIRNVQDENKEDENLVQTTSDEIKLSPYAKMVIEKKFTKCGHSTVEVIDIPDNLINMTEEEVQEKYKNWEIRSFTSKELSLYREIVANCDDHFVLKDKDGYLAIYTNITDDTLNLQEITNIDISSLPSGDIENLREGIYIYGKDELSSLLEDFNS